MIRRLFSQVTRKRPERTRQDAESVAPAAQADAPHPERPVYVVGDVHGRDDLLDELLERIDADIEAHGVDDPQLVFLGDYIDGGPDSDAVLDRLRELCRVYPEDVCCLMGAHERMMLDFLADPAARGPRWLRAGGGATIRSFAAAAPVPVPVPSPDAEPPAFRQTAAALRARLPEGLEEWLRALPLTWRSGNLWAVHAAADPQHPMDRQSPRVLLWGHPEFGERRRTDGAWIAHGHTPVAEPVCGEGLISLDTGACETGRLSACFVAPDGAHRFVMTGQKP